MMMMTIDDTVRTCAKKRDTISAGIVQYGQPVANKRDDRRLGLISSVRTTKSFEIAMTARGYSGGGIGNPSGKLT